MKTLKHIVLFMIGSVSLLLETLDIAIIEAKTSLEDQNPRLQKHLEDY